MILGTTSLIKGKKLTTAELKNLVTSPGGTTISALRILEKEIEDQTGLPFEQFRVNYG